MIIVNDITWEGPTQEIGYQIAYSLLLELKQKTDDISFWSQSRLVSNGFSSYRIDITIVLRNDAEHRFQLCSVRVFPDDCKLVLNNHGSGERYAHDINDPTCFTTLIDKVREWLLKAKQLTTHSTSTKTTKDRSSSAATTKRRRGSRTYTKTSASPTQSAQSKSRTKNSRIGRRNQ